MFGIVPKLQASVLEWPTVKASERLTSFMKHPAGPFTSASPPCIAVAATAVIVAVVHTPPHSRSQPTRL